MSRRYLAAGVTRSIATYSQAGHEKVTRKTSRSPFDRTAHRRNLLVGPPPGCGDHAHRLIEIAFGVLNERRLGLVQPPTIVQLVLGVEAEEIGRAHRAIVARHALG